MESFVLKGHICHSPGPTELECLENGYVVCVDGVSKGVFGAVPQEYSILPVVDYGDRLIIPGLVDLHVHAPQYSFRGMCMDLELMDWLAQHAFPEEAKFADMDYARRAYSIFVEALRRGATSRVSVFATRHGDATTLLMELMEHSGLVSYVGKVNMDREAPDILREAGAKASAAETLAWLKGISGRFKRTKPILTPRFVPSCSDSLMEELGKIQAVYDLPVQSHLSESPGEIELVSRLRPMNKFYGQAYNDYGLFGRDEANNTGAKTIMAHCVWSGGEEVELMKANGVFIAHCPASNTNICSGIAPIRKYLDRGLKVGLGSDVAGGHSDSIFRAMTDAIQVSKLYWRLVDRSAKPLTFPEAFYMATKGGGEFFGQVGSFEAGYEFDAVVLDDSILPHPQELTVLQRLERAAYLLLDMKGVCAKYVAGLRLFDETE